MIMEPMTILWKLVLAVSRFLKLGTGTQVLIKA